MEEELAERTRRRENKKTERDETEHEPKQNKKNRNKNERRKERRSKTTGISVSSPALVSKRKQIKQNREPVRSFA